MSSSFEAPSGTSSLYNTKLAPPALSLPAPPSHFAANTSDHFGPLSSDLARFSSFNTGRSTDDFKTPALRTIARRRQDVENLPTTHPALSHKEEAVISWVNTSLESDRMPHNVHWNRESSSPVHSSSDVDSFRETSFVSENSKNGGNVRPLPIKSRAW